MRRAFSANPFKAAMLAIVVAALPLSPTLAQSAPPSDVKGLWITTDFPTISLRAGEEAKLNIQLINYNLPPQRADISVEGAPAGWTAELKGGGRPVAATFIEHNNKSTLELLVRAPADT